MSSISFNSANSKLQKDRLELIITNVSYHQRVVIGAVCQNLINGDSGWTATSQIYNAYKEMLEKNIKPLSYRRIADLLVELKNTGLISSRTISRGRAGYGTEYRLCFAPHMIGPYVGKEWWDGVIKTKEAKDALDEITQMRKSRFGKRRTNIDYLLKKYGV